MLGVEPLDGPHGLPVVTELPVVVVLHDEAAGRPRPVHDGRPPRRVERAAGGELVGGREQDGPVAVVQPVDPGAVRVHAERPGADAVGGEEVAVEGQPVLLRRPGAAHHLREEPQPVRGPRAQHDALRACPHPAHPGQIAGQGPPQLWPPLRIARPERVVGGGGQRPARRAQPGGAREHRGVRPSLDEVVDRAGGVLAGGRPVYRGGRGDRGGPFGDPGPRALAGGEPPLRDQLRVGVGDGVAGQPQIGGERTVGRQPGPRGEPPAAHRVPQGGHQDGAAVAGAGELQRQIAAQDLGGIDP